jgi:DNA polymerase-3 subunit epsilon
VIREIVIDTETTGLDPAQGHRLVEVGAVELVNHLPTGRSFHSYLNPERDVPEDALRVHGLTAEFLSGYPTFPEIVDDLLAFLGEAPLIAHNAAFDLRFIDAELRRCRRDALGLARARDTLAMAQRRFPGAPASLDALCRRFAIDATARTKHGALLDSELLAEVYLHLLGGRQADLGLVIGGAVVTATAATRAPRPPRPHAASPEELAAHAAFIARLHDPVWLS